MDQKPKLRLSPLSFFNILSVTYALFKSPLRGRLILVNLLFQSLPFFIFWLFSANRAWHSGQDLEQAAAGSPNYFFQTFDILENYVAAVAPALFVLMGVAFCGYCLSSTAAFQAVRLPLSWNLSSNASSNGLPAASALHIYDRKWQVRPLSALPDILKSACALIGTVLLAIAIQLPLSLAMPYQMNFISPVFLLVLFSLALVQPALICAKGYTVWKAITASISLSYVPTRKFATALALVNLAILFYFVMILAAIASGEWTSLDLKFQVSRDLFLLKPSWLPFSYAAGLGKVIDAVALGFGVALLSCGAAAVVKLSSLPSASFSFRGSEDEQKDQSPD